MDSDRIRLTRRAFAFLPLTYVAGAAARPQNRPDHYPDVPFVPTPNEIVEAMLKLAGVKKGDVLIDLGSGDGRIVIAAAKQYGVRAVGVDIDPQRIQEAQENAAKAGVTELVKFQRGDLFQADIRNASVVTLYLLPSVNLKLKPKLLKELKPGTRIVSESFDMGDWKPEKEIEVNSRHLYLWTVPAPTPNP